MSGSSLALTLCSFFRFSSRLSSFTSHLYFSCFLSHPNFATSPGTSPGLSHCQHRNTASPPSSLLSLSPHPSALLFNSVYPFLPRFSPPILRSPFISSCRPFTFLSAWPRAATLQFSCIFGCRAMWKRFNDPLSPRTGTCLHIATAHRRETWKIVIDRHRATYEHLTTLRRLLLTSPQYAFGSFCFTARETVLRTGQMAWSASEYMHVDSSTTRLCGRKCSCSNCFYSFARIVFVIYNA